MQAFLHVTAALLPIVPYLATAPFGLGTLGAAAGLAWGAIGAARRHGGRRPPAIEIALMLGLAGALVVELLPVPGGPHGEALVMLALAIGATVSLVQLRPWTAAYAASAYGGAAGTPLFASVNRLTSALWAALFAWLALGSLLDLAPLLRYGPLAAGGITSVALPPLLMRRGLDRLARGGRHATWRPPAFELAQGAAERAVPALEAGRHGKRAAARSGAPSEGEEGLDIAVVGAGIGGLTAAALLADAGLRVAVFEQHDVAGGFAHHWTRSVRDPATGERVRFRFDAGVHDISGWQPGGTVRRLFERLGIADEDWRRLDHRHVFAAPSTFPETGAPTSTGSQPCTRGAATHGPGIEAVVISGAYAAEALLPGVLARPATRGPDGGGRPASVPVAA